MVKQQVVTRQRERNKGRFKDETNYSRKLGKVTFQNYCDSKISKSLWNGSGFNENPSAKFGSNYTEKAGCDRRARVVLLGCYDLGCRVGYDIPELLMLFCKTSTASL